MEQKTNVMRILDKKKVIYKVHDYSKTNAISGLEVSQVLQQDPNTVFKTLVTKSKSSIHYVFLVPVNKELNLKKAASSVGEKSVEMIKSKDLLPLTGYIHGGCSPIGMKKEFRVTIDSTAKNQSIIIFSAGKIGYQIETTLLELEKAIPFQLANITNEEAE